METTLNKENQISLPNSGWKKSRTILVALLGLMTLLATIYTIENWRGKRAWDVCKRELASKGHALDWTAYVPVPVPDDQNIFKAPNITEWFVGRLRGPGTTAFSKRLTLGMPADNAISADYLASSDQCAADFDLIREALKRPQARIDGDYQQPITSPIPNYISLRTTAQVLAKRAQCYLSLGQPEKALRELTLLHDLRKLLEARPIALVSAMIDVAINELYVDTIGEGLRLQVWREPELVAFQENLETINVLPLVNTGFKTDLAAMCRVYETMTANELKKVTQSDANTKIFWFLTLAPRGWVYQNIANQAAMECGIIESLNLGDSIVIPSNYIRADIKNQELSKSKAPYTFLACVSVPNFRKAIQAGAKTQTKVNQARIVCALERYRLAHSQYPDSLAALAPQFVGKLPHDTIKGEPLRYQRLKEGRFSLYSIGWNEKDDGGVPGEDQGDWVWNSAGSGN